MRRRGAHVTAHLQEIEGTREATFRARVDLKRRHTLVGGEMLRDVPFLPTGTRQVVRSHHERWDGHGYPDGLAGLEIPLLARMFALVDTSDALTSPRTYGPAGRSTASFS